MSEFEEKLKTLAFPCQLNTSPRSAVSPAFGRAMCDGR